MRFGLFAVLALGVSHASYAAESILDSIDKTVDPCVDFYQYSCGTWIKNHPLPNDRARYGSFDILQERNFKLLKDVLEKASVNDTKRSPVDQQIGDFYDACMDEATINKREMAPVQGLLDSIAALKNKDGLSELLATLYNNGVNVLFALYSQQDLKDATQEIATVDQGGMGLPSRDYYFETDDKSKANREKYVKHIANMLVLSGVEKDAAAAQAKAILAFETSLAGKALRPVDRREPARIYHPTALPDIKKMAPVIDWSLFLDRVGTPKVTSANVAVVEFIQNLNDLLGKTSLDDLKAYMRWRTLSASAPFLSSEFEAENFDFYGRTLNGQKEMRPRWWRCATKVDALLGEALGQAFVKIAFPGDSKQRTLDLIANIEKALKKDIETLPWMSPETKKQALLKLAAIAKKIGYPDKWRDYSTVGIARGDFFGNAKRANRFEQQRQLAKIGKPVDKSEWQMTPPEVNAYYDPSMNDINFPAGILQPPFFDRNWDDARNYGAIGMVIGHEITHGFDDQGRQFDAQGNMRDWWTKKDAERFNERAQCLVDEYGSFVAVRDAKNGDVKQDGKLTLGENAADNGGMRLSWSAFVDFARGDRAPRKDGFTPAQRFFLSYGQVWCNVQTEDAARNQAKTNPHSLGVFRVNGTVRNMPEFQKAFSCKTGQPMAPEKRCRIW